MKAFLDTSVLVATFYADHEHHSPSIDLFLRFGKKYACCGAHSLAENSLVLTLDRVAGFALNRTAGLAMRQGAEQ